APMGALRAFETTKRSLALGNNEWARLDRETRAGEVLYTQHGEVPGTTQVVLQQPVQPTGNNEPRVPQIQDDELRVRNAGANLRDQARAQNVTYFLERDKQKWQQPASTEAVDQLTSSIAGQPTLPVAVQPPPPTDPAEDNRMDTETTEKGKSQDDVAMGDHTGVHKSESMENGVTKQA
ncbi:MAG: hypothetical protein GY832_18310, partial [Chloroflexi bacterium]|nr:hypothetical protein [Chloroflexota bacterium]